MNFSFRPHRLLTAVVTLSLVFLTGFSANAQDLLEREYNAPNDGETLNIEANQNLVIHCNSDGGSFTFNNYSGSGDVYYYAQMLSYIGNGVPSGYTGSKIFIAGNALGLPNSQTSSDVYGSGRILVLTNEVPGATDTVFEGTLFNASGSSPTYDNNIQIKGAGGLRVGWSLALTVSGKISDYTDANGNVTPGKLIIEHDGENIYITNGANDYSGGTQISGGNCGYGSGAATLTVQVDGTPLGTGPISFGAENSTLALNNKIITVGGFDGETKGTVSGSDTLTINSDLDYTGAASLNNIGTLVKNGTGSQTVAGASITNLTINNGTMGFSGALTADNVSIASGATLKMDGANSSLTTSSVNIVNGATLYFDNATPRNSADTPLAINIEKGGTLEFHETDTGESHANTTLVTSNKISITGSGNLIKSGPGDLFASSGSGIWQNLSIILDSNATIDVREGCLANGNYYPDCWKSTVDNVTTYNQATLNIEPKGTVDLWDGTLYVGGITGGSKEGENHGEIISPKYNSTLVVGMGINEEKSYTFNGNVDLNSGRTFTKEGATTQIFDGNYKNLGTTNVNDGTLELSGTATLGTTNVNGGTLEISSNDATLKTSNLNGGSLDISGNVNLETINFADGGKINVIQNGVATLTKTTSLNQYTNINVDSSASFIVDPGDEQPVVQSQPGELNINGVVTVKSGYFRVLNVPDRTTIILDGGTLQNNGDSDPKVYNSTVNANVILASDSRLMGGWGDKGGNLAVNGEISGSAKLIIRNDGGTVYVNHTNVHTGGTQIGDNYNSGNAKLVMGANNALGTGPISFGSNNSTLDMATFSQVFNGIDNQNGSGGNFSGNRIFNDADLLESPTFNAAEGTNFIYTGTLPTMSGTLTKNGKGSQTIVSADAEDVNVTEGIMAFSGALTANNVSIANGATLKMTGTGSSINVTNPVNIQDGATLYFENAVPHNDNKNLTINIAEGGTLKFKETDAGEHNDNNSLVRNASKNVTITGDGSFIKTGAGRLFISSQDNDAKVTIVLSDNALIDVQEGDLVNGGWEPNCWKYSDNSAYNQATLNVGPNGAVDLWDGTLYVGGITGGAEEGNDHKGMIKSSNRGTIIVGMDMTAANKTFTYNGDLDLSTYGKEGERSDCIFTKEGATTQIFTGFFKNLGTTNVNDGTLELTGTGTLGTVNVNKDTDAQKEGTLKISGGTTEVTGALKAAGNIIIASGATLKMSGANSSFTAANPVTIPNGATLYFDEAVPKIKGDLSLIVNSGGTLVFYETAVDEYNADCTLVQSNAYNFSITGNGNIIKFGAGDLFLFNNNYNNNTSIVLEADAIIDIQGGRFVNGNYNPDCWKTTVDGNTKYNQATLNVGPNGTVDLWDGTLYVGGITGDIDGDNHGLIKSQNNGKLVVGMGMTDTKTFTYNGDLDLTNFGKTVPHSDCTFTKEGETTQSFTGTYYNLGTTNVNGGTLEFSGNATLGTINFANDGNIKVTQNGVATLTKEMTFTPTTPINVDNTATLILDPGDDNNNVQNYTEDFTIGGSVIVKSGYLRTTNVSSATTLVLDGGILKNNGEAAGSNNVSTINSNITLLSNSSLMAGWTNGKMFVNGVVFGDAKLIIRNDMGNVYLNNANNSYTGGTQVGDNFNNSYSGHLVAGAENVLGTGRLYFGNDNSTFDMAGFAQTIGGLGKDMNIVDEVQYTGSVNNSGAETTLTIDVPEGETYNYNGSVANNVSIVKTGAGTQQFNLDENATFSGSIVVNSGRLDMKEYYRGTLEVEADGVFSPGNSIGTLNLTGDFNLDGGALLMEIGGPTIADSDQLIINGNLLLNDGSILLDFINGMAPNAEFAVVLDANNSQGLDEDYVLSFVDSYYFTNLSYSIIDGLWTLSGQIDPNAVPEPSTWALLVLGVFGLLYLRKRK